MAQWASKTLVLQKKCETIKQFKLTPFQVPEDGGMDGQCGDGNPEGVRLQGLHLRRVQEGERQLPCKELAFKTLLNS